MVITHGQLWAQNPAYRLSAHFQPGVTGHWVARSSNPGADDLYHHIQVHNGQLVDVKTGFADFVLPIRARMSPKSV